MKKNSDFLSDNFEDFKPRKTKIAKKSRQMSFYELNNDEELNQPKRKKNVNYKRY